MPATVATLAFIVGILGLFMLDGDRKSRVSPALWIPIIWVSIGASRMVSQWFGLAGTADALDQYVDGSPLDRAILTGLLIAGVAVLLSRGRRSREILAANGPLLVFFLYCLVSLIWSDYPLVTFKRWTKGLGNLVMVLVVLTERDSTAAVKRFLARTGFLLIPLSILLIKYYPELGRAFSPWTGEALNNGVATSKNGLGSICLVFGIASLWRFLTALQRPRMRGPLIAHGVILALTLWLFRLIDAATSLGCFLAGAFLIALATQRWFAVKRMAVHTLTFAIVAVFVFGLFVAPEVGLIQTVGRDATLTGRTELWNDLFRISVNPWIGAGFETFWLGDRMRSLWERHWWHPNQAHNGYIEIYITLGYVGLALLGFVIVWGYRNVIRSLYRESKLGKVKLALFTVALLGNLTDALFKAMHPVWIVFLLVIAVVPGPVKGQQFENSASEGAIQDQSPPSREIVTVARE